MRSHSNHWRGQIVVRSPVNRICMAPCLVYTLCTGNTSAVLTGSVCFFDQILCVFHTKYHCDEASTNQRRKMKNACCMLRVVVLLIAFFDINDSRCRRNLVRSPWNSIQSSLRLSVDPIDGSPPTPPPPDTLCNLHNVVFRLTNWG